MKLFLCTGRHPAANYERKGPRHNSNVISSRKFVMKEGRTNLIPVCSSLFCCLLLFLTAGTLDAEVSVDLEVNTAAVKKGEDISLTVRVSNNSEEEKRIPLPKSYKRSIQITSGDKTLVEPGENNVSESTKLLSPGEFFGKKFSVNLPRAWQSPKELTVSWTLKNLESNTATIYFIPDRVCRMKIKDYGTVYLEFFPGDAPRNVFHFMGLVKDGFYDDLTFHRLVPDFVLQGGDPEGDGTGGRTPSVEAELNDRKHQFGTVSMAHGHKTTESGTQFFFSLGRHPFLDGKYTVIGSTANNESNGVLRKIQSNVKTDHVEGEQCGRDHMDRPKNPVVIEEATLISRKKYREETSSEKKGNDRPGSGEQK